MTDREFQMLQASINQLREEVRQYAEACIPCRAQVNVFQSQGLDKRLSKMEHNWTLMVGAALGGGVLGSGGVTLALRYVIGA